jgi:hypothetical protein
MAGTKIGGQKAAAKNLANNPNFYREIGTKGGRNGNSGGFAARIKCHCQIVRGAHITAQCAGVRGGMKSRRTYSKTARVAVTK